MTKKRYAGIILCTVGVIVAGIGLFWGSSWIDSRFPNWKEGPYAMTVGAGGLAIVMAGVFFLTWPPTWK